LTNEEIIEQEEKFRSNEIGRLVVRYDQRIDDDNSLALSTPGPREIGIILGVDADMDAHVYWQETGKYETLWLGRLTYISNVST
jgi:hypothetical protein